jgi:hypothetical protein
MDVRRTLIVVRRFFARELAGLRVLALAAARCIG